MSKCNSGFLNLAPVSSCPATAVRAPDPNGAPPVPYVVRRDLLGAFASMLLLLPVEAGASKAAELDGELIAACAEFGRLEAAHEVACRAEDRAPEGPDKDRLLEQVEAILNRQIEIYDALCDVPARTPEGLRAKAQALSSWFQKASNGTPSRHEDQLAWSLVRDIAGRA